MPRLLAAGGEGDARPGNISSNGRLIFIVGATMGSRNPVNLEEPLYIP